MNTPYGLSEAELLAEEQADQAAFDAAIAEGGETFSWEQAQVELGFDDK